MCWMSQFGGNGRKILHLQVGDRWLPYSSCPQLSVPDYRVPNGSLGWATYQKLIKAGWELVTAPRE